LDIGYQAVSAIKSNSPKKALNRPKKLGILVDLNPEIDKPSKVVALSPVEKKPVGGRKKYPCEWPNKVAKYQKKKVAYTKN
jgi:hypothetical protein